jgi:hypothetical protein
VWNDGEKHFVTIQEASAMTNPKKEVAIVGSQRIALIFYIANPENLWMKLWTSDLMKLSRLGTSAL